MHLHPFEAQEGESPSHQFHVRFYIELSRSVQLNAAANHVGKLPGHGIRAYVRVDLGVTWRVSPSLELGAWGQNLLDRRHPELSGTSSNFRTEVPRSFFGQVTWRH